MSLRRLRILLVVTTMALLATLPAAADSLPAWGPTLQLGPIPLASATNDWALAVPLGLDRSQCSLDTPDASLQLRTVGTGETWLVVRAHKPGPISGLLQLNTHDGATLKIAIAAEGISVKPDQTPSLLMVAQRGDAPLRRMLHLPTAATAVEFGGRSQNILPPDSAGWQLLEVPPPTGMTEKQGRIHLTGGGEIPLQVSLLESITTLAATLLPAGWSYDRLTARSEKLEGTNLRAGFAVVGARAGARVLRRYDLRRDTRTNEYRFFALGATDLPPINTGSPHKLLQVRAHDVAKAIPVRQPFLVRLVRDRAYLIDPRKGLIGQSQIRGLNFSGAATRSLMKRDQLFSVRSDALSGVRYLRRWWVGLNSGRATLRGQLFETPLRERMGVTDLRAFDLQPWDLAVRRGELPARESLLLLGAQASAAKGAVPLEVYELWPRSDGSGVISHAIRRYTSPLAWPLGSERPTMQFLNTPTVGTQGFPRRLQIGVPGILSGETVSLNGVGERFVGQAYVQGVNHAIRMDGYSLNPIALFHSEFDGHTSTLRRRTLSRDGLQTMGRGQLTGRRVLDLRASIRGRHLFTLSDNGGGGVEGRYAIRMLSNSLPAGTNLPPRVDAGPDLSAAATGRGTASVRLRANLSDANNDPLAVRWSAPGVFFSNPNSRITRAEFPRGTTQVRLRARETGGKALRYEGYDLLDVTVVAPPSGVPETPALATALRGIFPNPANPRVRIAFTVEKRSRVRVSIYDVSGRLVRQLLNEERNSGAYDVLWDGTDDQGRAVGSGVYPVRLNAAGKRDTDRAVIVR